MEAKRYRLQRSLSDLNGTDPLIHGGTPEGLLQVLANVFDPPGAPRGPLEPIFEHLSGRARDLGKRYGGLYTPGAFAEFVAAAIRLTTRLGQG